VNTVWIVITSINHPTSAVREFAQIARKRGGGVVVVGDTKSPANYHHDGVVFLSIRDQQSIFPALADKIPTRSYARKNLGYLYAMRQGAQIIIDTDDDNRPLPGFAERLGLTVAGPEVGGADWVNVYSYFTDALIWPRGLPLNRIHEKGRATTVVERQCPVQQFLADEDPDVDAIYRLLYREPVRFRKDAHPLVVARNTFCPFNSQNTVFFAEAFGLMYLPSFVSFRMTDIWRSFVAQRVLWEGRGQLSFHPSTVFQERNAHDLMKDFDDEVIGYLRNDTVGKQLSNTSLKGLSDSDAVTACYAALRDIGIIKEEELMVLAAWNEARMMVNA
jgi:glycosyltransferase involved in cell wall biosynthesis